MFWLPPQPPNTIFGNFSEAPTITSFAYINFNGSFHLLLFVQKICGVWTRIRTSADVKQSSSVWKVDLHYIIIVLSTHDDADVARSLMF